MTGPTAHPRLGVDQRRDPDRRTRAGPPGAAGRLRVHRRLPTDYLDASLRSDARRGLTATPKWLPSRWLYDARGSALFDQVTRLPGYYLTRAEREILGERAGRLAAEHPAATLVELGSGSSAKTRLLIDALEAAGTLRRYVPIDVSENALLDASAALLGDYPNLAIHAVVADFTEHLTRLPTVGRRFVAFFGSTFGNLGPVERAGLLADLRHLLGPGDGFLLGVDLVKDPRHLLAAYDDPGGVTAEFNRNVLNVLNRELGATFDPARFRYRVRWNAEQEWIEMWLYAEGAQAVWVADLGLAIDFGDGEGIRTAISAKFRPAGIEAELAAAGLSMRHCWTDSASRFALCLSTIEKFGSGVVRSR